MMPLQVLQFSEQEMFLCSVVPDAAPPHVDRKSWFIWPDAVSKQTATEMKSRNVANLFPNQNEFTRLWGVNTIQEG